MGLRSARPARSSWCCVGSSFNLFTRVVVAIDGSKFKAVNTRDKNFTVTKVSKWLRVDCMNIRKIAAEVGFSKPRFKGN